MPDLFEIEVKARVHDEGKLLDKLREIDCALSDPVTQRDIIFWPPGVAPPHPRSMIALRIREADGRYTFTFKQNRANQLDCIEHETEISDPVTMEAIIKLLGFAEFTRVTKTRRKGKYKDVEICLDRVEKLGTFVEVEKMSGEDGEKVQKELFAFLRTLGVPEEDRVYEGYDVLMKKLSG